MRKYTDNINRQDLSLGWSGKTSYKMLVTPEREAPRQPEGKEELPFKGNCVCRGLGQQELGGRKGPPDRMERQAVASQAQVQASDSKSIAAEVSVMSFISNFINENVQMHTKARFNNCFSSISPPTLPPVDYLEANPI